jgi:hypothetical protein
LQPIAPATWALAGAYTANTLVRYADSLIYMANGDVPANTAWVIGTTGATWRQVGSGGGAGLDVGTYKQTAQQSLTHNIETKITGFTALNASGQWDNANNRFLISVAGLYAIRGRVSFVQVNTTGIRQAIIKRNNTIVSTMAVDPSATAIVTAQVTETLSLNVGDYIELWAWQNSGVLTQTGVTASGHFSELEIVQLPTQTIETGVPVNDQAASGFFDIGNMRIQWGINTQDTTAERTVTLPAVFANTSYTVTLTSDNGATALAFAPRVGTVGGKTTTNFKARMSLIDGTASGINFSWQAIGRKP